MRSALVLGVLGLAVVLAGPQRGLAGSDMRFVTVAEAEVRAGPGTGAELYVTNRLRQNDPVEVVDEMDTGWLKIKPPDGSFSWINTLFLSHLMPNKRNWVVSDANTLVKVYTGSISVQGRPRVVGVQVKRGTQVLSVGPSLADAEGTWMPIEPPEGEFRYIRAEQVSRRAQSAPSAGPGSATLANTGRSGEGARPVASGLEQQWLQAQQAERAGQVHEAIRLYLLVGADTVSSNPVRSAEAIQRAQYLQANSRNVASAAGLARAPTDTSYTNPPAAAAQPGSVNPARIIPPSAAIPGATVSTAGAPQQATTAKSLTYYGRLRQAGRVIDGRQTYVLEIRNYPMLYVTPQMGLDLDPWINRDLELTGPVVYSGSLRTWVLTAYQMRPVR